MSTEVEVRSDVGPWPYVNKVLDALAKECKDLTEGQLGVLRQFILQHLSQVFGGIITPGVAVCTIHVSWDYPEFAVHANTVADRVMFYKLLNGDLWLSPSAPAEQRVYKGFDYEATPTWAPGFVAAARNGFARASVIPTTLPNHGNVTLVADDGETYRIEALAVICIQPDRP